MSVFYHATHGHFLHCDIALNASVFVHNAKEPKFGRMDTKTTTESGPAPNFLYIIYYSDNTLPFCYLSSS